MIQRFQTATFLNILIATITGGIMAFFITMYLCPKFSPAQTNKRHEIPANQEEITPTSLNNNSTPATPTGTPSSSIETKTIELVLNNLASPKATICTLEVPKEATFSLSRVGNKVTIALNPKTTLVVENIYEIYPFSVTLLGKQIYNPQFGKLEIIKHEKGEKTTYTYSNRVKKTGVCYGIEKKYPAPCGEPAILEEKGQFLLLITCKPQDENGLNLCNRAVSSLKVKALLKEE